VKSSRAERGPAEAPPPQRNRPVISKPRHAAWVWLVALGLLGLNLAVALRIPSGHERLSVPYSFFRAQAQDGNVAEVTSKGDAIQGKFRRTVRYPAGDEGEVSHLFKTQRPAFADDRLLDVLLDKRRSSMRDRSTKGGRCWPRCCSASAPRCC
jgi:cell division protease FtsH